MPVIKIDKIPYQVNDNEFLEVKYPEYNNLRILGDIGHFERIISLISELVLLNINNICVIKPTHGGYIPIHCAKKFDNVYLLNVSKKNDENIQTNVKTFHKKYMNSSWCKNNIENIINEPTSLYNLPMTTFEKKKLLIFSEDSSQIDYDFIKDFTPLLITSYNKQIMESKLYHSVFKLSHYIMHSSHPNLYVYVPEHMHSAFIKEFHYFLKKMEGEEVLDYDNLIHLCIMVKNGGPQFESMLKDNMNHIDSWTILDTGSTDDTIKIINRVLVGKKKGQLFQEPFINFRESRNRCLDLAGKSCKYLIMLDDTYVVEGDLRFFLNKVRGEQFSNSFSLIIQSDDVKYGSNRIITSNSDLRYIHTIHEVITDKGNINVLIPEEEVTINDRRFDYMEKRTMERKTLDLQLLYEELEENPTDPRTYYYLGQTYNLLEDYENAYKFFLRRGEFTNAGFIQERLDAVFEAARIANFKINKPWEECLALYEACFKIDETRPEAMYFIGVHYYLEKNIPKAYEYFKRGFEIGFPEKAQYSLKPTLSFHFLPSFLAKICYQMEDYVLGEKACELFLQNNDPNKPAPNTDPNIYNEVVSWYQIYKKLNVYQGNKIPKIQVKPIICFLADGGFEPWNGKNIYTSGVGGSETFVIEIARNVKKLLNEYEVYVFCNCLSEEEIDGVLYKPLSQYYSFINENYIHSCIISRYSEYLPLTYKGFAENVYLLLHDLTPSGVVMPLDKKLKNVFCLTEWHVEHFTTIFPTLKDITQVFSHGIDIDFFTKQNLEISDSDSDSKKTNQIIENKFIYSSFPNRGLLPLLQMWPKIYEKESGATLHIYSDVDGKWVNSVVPEHMTEIRKLLEAYKKRENGLGIVYHGWVSKSELAKAWQSADIWFYPCIFQETFCLTALEAALTKTFVVTNDLAALKNTVGDRGLIIKGDPMTNEWQKEALEKLFRYVDKKNKHFKNILVDSNYRWASGLSWESQAKKFLDLHILSNNLEYKGVYSWVNDYPSGCKTAYLEILSEINKKSSFNNRNISDSSSANVLEIGTYNGISLINIVKNIPYSTGVGIDKWEVDDTDNLLKNIENLSIEKSFYKNIENEGFKDKIRGIKGEPMQILTEMIKKNDRFDFISINNRGTYLDHYSDLLLSWELLNKGGIIGINVFMYEKNKRLGFDDNYIENINHFIKIKKSEIETTNKNNIFFIRKR